MKIVGCIIQNVILRKAAKILSTRVSKTEEHELDLMMVSRKKEGWVNVYKDNQDERFTNEIFESEEEAMKNMGCDMPMIYITTTKIE